MRSVRTVKCLICGEVGSRITPLCDSCNQSCREEEVLLITRIGNLIKVNSFLTPEQISEKTMIPLHTVKWYYKNRKLGSSSKVIDDGKQSGVSMTAIRYDKYIWIDVGGKIDSQNAAILQEYIDSLIKEGWTNIVLDMSEIKFFSSNGIRVVLATYKKLHEDGSFYIAFPSSNVENVLGMVALDKMLLK